MKHTFSYTPSDADANFFADGATGASWPLAATDIGDGLAHQITILNNSATDHSAKTATIVGTNANDAPLTVVLALPGSSATVTSVAYFKTVTSITPSATIGADTMDIGFAATALTPAYPVNYRQSNFKVTVGINISGTIQYDLLMTPDDLWGNEDDITWYTSGTIADETADSLSEITTPVTAVRVAIDSLTAGATLAVTYLQGNNQ